MLDFHKLWNIFRKQKRNFLKIVLKLFFNHFNSVFFYSTKQNSFYFFLVFPWKMFEKSQNNFSTIFQNIFFSIVVALMPFILPQKSIYRLMLITRSLTFYFANGNKTENIRRKCCVISISKKNPIANIWKMFEIIFF